MLQIFNRGMECWRDFDTKYFKIDRKLREAAILKDKQEIIARINSDFQKLYFPKKADGTVCELEDMTYAEVARCGKKALFCNAILQSQKPNAFATSVEVVHTCGPWAFKLGPRPGLRPKLSAGSGPGPGAGINLIISEIN